MSEKSYSDVVSMCIENRRFFYGGDMGLASVILQNSRSYGDDEIKAVLEASPENIKNDIRKIMEKFNEAHYYFIYHGSGRSVDLSELMTRLLLLNKGL